MYYEFEEIAEVCHEAYRAYCASIGDNSQKSWKAITPRERSNTLDAIYWLLDNPKATGKKMHDAWVRNKKNCGWKYGPVKSEENKTHPCMVPYDKLGPRQKKKDDIFITITKGFLP